MTDHPYGDDYCHAWLTEHRDYLQQQAASAETFDVAAAYDTATTALTQLLEAPPPGALQKLFAALTEQLCHRADQFAKEIA